MKTKYFRLMLLLLVGLTTVTLTACGDDDDEGNGDDLQGIVGTWRLAELRTDAWMEKYGALDGKHSEYSKSYGMSNGIWEVTYTFDRDGYYTYEYLDEGRLRSQSGTYTYSGNSIYLSGETYDVSIVGDRMEWSRLAERNELSGILSGTIYYKMEYATWYKVN